VEINDHLQLIKNAVLQPNKDDIQNLVAAAMEAGLEPDSIILIKDV